MTPSGTIFLGVGSTGGSGVTLDVFPESEFGGERAFLRDRADTGPSYDYSYGVRNRYAIQMNYVPASLYLVITSYWESSAVLGVITGSDVIMEQARIVNNDPPLMKSPDMYLDLYRGVLELLEY